MTERVFVTRKIPEKGLKLLKDEVELHIWKEEFPPTKEEIIRQAKDSSGLITLLSDSIDAEVIDKLSDLKIISQYAVGYDNIDIEKATEKKIMVTNTPGVLTETTADLTWALIFAASRRIVEADRYVRNKRWEVAWSPELLLGKDIYGATLGIIGLGRIGTAVAKRAKGFSMDILYTTRSVSKKTKLVERELNATRCNLDNLLEKSDIVTIHVPLTEETYNMIGSRELSLMPKGSIIVNTSRGPIINQDALITKLSENHLFAAGLDVFQNEPLETDSKLLQLENVVLAPHIGSASIATREKMSTICAQNLIQGLHGETPENLVNPDVLDM
ncbi:MAG: D-glycerate dehydrogenase [Candidatus Lokiarchaeota archaeon]|nr:D-glycerate dehydrogenase [Candidatus Lokiarchaeota archaeon]